MNEPIADSGNAAPAAAGAAAPAGTAAGTAVLPVLALIVALCAGGFSVFHWYQGRGADDTLRHELAQRLAEMAARDQAAAARADQAAAALREAEIKVGVLEAKLAESQSQQIALEALYQELSRNRDEWAFAEIEQSVLLASQQLQVAANVRAALIGLENAEARLQRMEQPRYNMLRRAIVRDIERLKALPLADVYGTAARIDDAISAIDRLPLAMDARSRPDTPPAEPAAGLPAWERLLREAWQELRQLVRVQRTGVEDAALLPPEQVFFLRENLKLRMLGARLALLSRDVRSYQADLRAASAALERHFDMNDAAVAASAAALRRLQAAQIEIAVPDLAETLDALRRLRPSRGRAPA
ncbi:MAG: uroporphyrinogen-III C-methyltransferase [Burkholderiales bacterium]|nr:uroporphyrinogen-III C-methyltransferase [Burkholderiales bacterium]